MSDPSTDPLDCFKCKNYSGCGNRKARIARAGKMQIDYSDKYLEDDNCHMYIQEAYSGEGGSGFTYDSLEANELDYPNYGGNDYV